eukprot:TRINITY_DN11051_c0_g1_i1.p1 TRINITY_DN11051_c0_g1~~TRINITY_DN11051_c0_g1_i1.p1  ORF type:complete len:1047 (+),score=220.73 TRINITY_DN11051_c0_g1_i1:67-3207(+)
MQWKLIRMLRGRSLLICLWLIADPSLAFIRCGPGEELKGGTCSYCSPGRFNPIGGGKKCAECEPGRYAGDAKSTTCLACPMGRYNPTVGRPYCNSCPIGAECSVANGTDPDTGIVTFHARNGYFFLGSPDTTLQRFLDQIEQPDWTAYDRRGFEDLGPFKCFADQCGPKNTCAPGSEGILCGSCSPGFYHEEPEEKCTECRPGAWTITKCILVMLTIWLAAWIVDRKQVLAAGQPQDLASVILKIMYTFLIVFSVVASNIRLRDDLRLRCEQHAAHYLWAGSLRLVIYIGETLENPSKTVFSLKCLYEALGGSGNLIGFTAAVGWLALPVMLMLNFSLMLTFQVVLQLRTGTMSMRSLLAKPCELLRPAYAVSVVITYLLHPMITSIFLSLFGCVSHDEEVQLGYGTQRLRLDTSVDCNSDHYRSVQTIATLGLVVWAFGIPVFFLTVLCVQESYGKDSLASQKVWRSYGFLMDGYEADFYFYDTVFMFRRVLFLFCAQFYWFSQDLRTVGVLVISTFFLGLQLHHNPFDNRAYFGLDKLEYLASFTLSLFLWGRIMDFMFEKTKNDLMAASHYTAYVPAIIYFFYFFAFASYLAVRFKIWPRDRPSPVLPTWLASRLDGRAHLTLIPPTADECTESASAEDWMLSSKTLNDLTDGHGDVEDRVLPDREHQALKMLFGEVVGVVLKRHELCMREAPDVISLPSFMLQVERLMAACMGRAYKERLQTERDERSQQKVSDAFTARVSEHLHSMEVEVQEHDMFQKSWQAKKEGDTAMTPSVRSLVHEKSQQITHLLKQPLCVEEMHLALLQLSPQLLDSTLNREDNVLGSIGLQQKSILDAHSNVTWLYEAETHKERLASFRKGTDEELQPLQLEYNDIGDTVTTMGLYRNLHAGKAAVHLEEMLHEEAASEQERQQSGHKAKLRKTADVVMTVEDVPFLKETAVATMEDVPQPPAARCRKLEAVKKELLNAEDLLRQARRHRLQAEASLQMSAQEQRRAQGMLTTALKERRRAEQEQKLAVEAWARTRSELSPGAGHRMDKDRPGES